MEIKANVFLFLSYGVDRPASCYEPGCAPAIWDHLLFSDKEGSLLRSGKNQATAWVRFFRHVDRHGSRRTVEIFAEREGFDPLLPGVVICGAGGATWCSADTREELGRIGYHYGSVSILRPGVKPAKWTCESVLLPNRRRAAQGKVGGIVLGSWGKAADLAEAEDPVLWAVTAPFGTVQEDPKWDGPGGE